MEGRCPKKSTMEQLNYLVRSLEENPNLTRGIPIFGSNRLSADEDWAKICQTLNSLGPPTRSVGEWKKTWADLKSRTKKKIAENKKSMNATGGGLYRFNHLTELEEIIDRTLHLSSAAAPEGVVFGCEVSKTVDDGKTKGSSCELDVENTSFETIIEELLETPPRPSKVVKNIYANRKDVVQSTTNSGVKINNLKRNVSENTENEIGSSKKTKKPTCTDQISLIKRQLEIAENNATTATEQANTLKRLLDVVEAQANATTAKENSDTLKRLADAVESQTKATKEQTEAITRYAKSIELILETLISCIN
ncbi:uncharacterized protein [Musca autumnalis]|uniref:uncharacterized protein n=1 Tax=Musca autumnalis TaxID=221902 RepID=UPI003CF6C3A5